MAVNYQWRELPQVSFLSRQTCVCRSKTRLLSRQKYVCRKNIIFFSPQKFFAPSILLSRQKMCFVFCRDKIFVATKIILVAAPANDSNSTSNNQNKKSEKQPVTLLPLRFVIILIKQQQRINGTCRLLQATAMMSTV